MRTRRHSAMSTREIRVDRPLRSCIERIAVRCSLDCCGVDACALSPVLLELWADSVGKDDTRSAIAQATDIVRLCDESADPLSCDFLGYRERRTPAANEETVRGDSQRARHARRKRLRDFFASLAERLRPYA